MNINDELTLSYFKELFIIKKNVFIVQNIQNNKIYVKKVLTTYDQNIYNKLIENSFDSIPKIHHIIESEENLIIIEDYIQFPSLQTLLAEHGAFPIEKSLKITLKICEALLPFHNQNPPIIHRDLKPSNILYDELEQIFILDFNAAKVFDSNKHKDTVLIGTANYAAPEQFGFSQSDIRTDIFSIGVLLAELLTNKPYKSSPYNGEALHIVKKCTNIDPDKRYQNLLELIKDISKELKTVSVKKTSLRPPGFRSLTPWKIALALFGYISFAGSSYFTEFTDVYSPFERILSKILSFIFMISIVFYYFNFLGIQDKLLFGPSKNIFIKIIGGIFWPFIFFIILSIVLYILQSM